MILSSIVKTRKIKQFSFTPRYYDEDKEELKSRIAQVQSQLNGETTYTNTSPIRLKDQWKRSRKVPSTLEKKSNLRIAGIIAALTGFFYWFLS